MILESSRSLAARKNLKVLVKLLLMLILVEKEVVAGGQDIYDKMQADASFMTDSDKKGLYEFIRYVNSDRKWFDNAASKQKSICLFCFAVLRRFPKSTFRGNRCMHHGHEIHLVLQ